MFNFNALKRNIFIFHGSYGHPQENWFPWLKGGLEKLGHRVFVPQFPVPQVQTPGGHKLSQWLEAFEPYRKYVDKNTILIAHSRGCVFCYHLLPTFTNQITATFLVGHWIHYIWYNNSTNDSFHSQPFEWGKIKQKSKTIDIYQSTNDEIPVNHGKELAQKLDAKLHIFKDSGHFNTYTYPRFSQFPELLDDIKTKL
jgi:predicted alpha/beta hydrolase family esterase